MADIRKAAIVTGASQGIGAGLVDAFLNRGYSVVANARNISKASPQRRQISRWSMETSATRKRLQRSWIPRYHDLGGSMC